VQLKDGYASLSPDGEVWLHNVHISPYEPASRENHEAERPRKLLLHKREIERLIGKTQEKGLTLVPTRLYFKGRNAKVEIALARGKEMRDKRRALRDQDQRREIERALREGRVQLKDAYAIVRDGEVWLYNVHIAPYAPAARDNHEPERPRKLLMHKREIERLIGKTQEKGLTLVPTRMYFKGRNAKVEIALARGKDVRDRRRDIKAREQRREIERALAERG